MLPAQDVQLFCRKKVQRTDSFLPTIDFFVGIRLPLAMGLRVTMLYVI